MSYDVYMYFNFIWPLSAFSGLFWLSFSHPFHQALEQEQTAREIQYFSITSKILLRELIIIKAHYTLSIGAKPNHVFVNIEIEYLKVNSKKMILTLSRSQ